MQQYNDMLASDEELKAAYEQAHNLYLAFRHELAGRLGDSEEHIEGTSAGGMPVRVKCLHALLAQSWLWDRASTPLAIWYWNASKTNSIRPSAAARWTIDQQMSQREQSIHTH